MSRRLASLFFTLSLVLSLAGVASASRTFSKIGQKTAKSIMREGIEAKHSLGGLNVRYRMPQGTGHALQEEVPIRASFSIKKNVRFVIAPPKGATARINVRKGGGAPEGRGRLKNLRIKW